MDRRSLGVARSLAGGVTYIALGLAGIEDHVNELTQTAGAEDTRRLLGNWVIDSNGAERPGGHDEWARTGAVKRLPNPK